MSDVTMPKPVIDQLRRRWQPGPDYKNDPRRWVADKGNGLFLWGRQYDIMEAVVKYPQVAVKSCHSAGKSFEAAQLAVWWIDAHPPGEAFVVTSAPTGDQVKAILWREINRAHKRLSLPGRMNQVEWHVDGELVAFGRKPNDYEPTAFQGIHARYVLVILDEACGIPDSLWEAASSLVSNEHGRILAIGNPDDPQSHFAKVCDYDTWHVIRISAFDTPNFTGEEVPAHLRELLVSKRWVEEKRKEWGERSPLWISKVTGEFPTDAEDGVIPYSWLSQCHLTELPAQGEVELGVDPARGGADRAVVWARKGPKALRKWVEPYTPDPKALAEWVLDCIKEVDAKVVKVDADGLGWAVPGILDVFHEEGRHDAISIGVLGSDPADDDEHYLNKRAEVWWTARERSRLHEWDLTALDDDDLHELSVPKYHTQNPRSRIQVEKKGELKKRLGRSPDSADALLLAYHEEVWEAELMTNAVVNARVT